MAVCCDFALPALSHGRLLENAAVLARLIDRSDASPRHARVHATGFVAPYGFAVLEALRRRRARHDALFELHEPASAEYAQPFSTVIGYGDGRATGSPTTIPLRTFDRVDGEAIGDYLMNEWASRAASLAAEQRARVVDAVAEIFVNGLTHARSDVGVIACGQYYPKTLRLDLSVCDLGISIPGSLAAAGGRREEEIVAERALAWAFERGNSSLATSRGLGLSIVRGFLERAGGVLDVISGCGAARLEGGVWNVRALPVRFPGTLVDLQLPVTRIPPVDRRQKSTE